VAWRRTASSTIDSVFFLGVDKTMANRRSRLTTFGAIDAFFGGIGFILTTPRIWPLAAVPAVVLTIVLIGLTALGIWGAAESSAFLFGHDRGIWGSIGYWFLTVFLVLITFLIALVLALAVAEPLSAFALERISAAQQRTMTGSAPTSPPLLTAMWLSLCCVCFAIVLGGSALVVLFLLDFFFPPAAIVTVPLKMLVCSWMVAWNLLDYPLGMRGMGLLARMKWVGRHFGAFTLFGFLWAIVGVVPGIILVLLPMGVAGATRLVICGDTFPMNNK
jgi:CysZ protein